MKNPHFFKTDSRPLKIPLMYLPKILPLTSPRCLLQMAKIWCT